MRDGPARNRDPKSRFIFPSHARRATRAGGAATSRFILCDETQSSAGGDSAAGS